MVKNILLVGVGGQGTILASKLLSAGLLSASYDVKMSEIHGMSQRGGSVSTHVRYGTEVDSPVIDEGTADVIVSFELMEAVRWLPYLRPNGTVVVNTHTIPSMPILGGSLQYPDNLLELLKSKAKTLAVDTTTEALKLGNPKVMNVILLGLTVAVMGLKEVDWDSVIRENVKPAFADINVKAMHVFGQEWLDQQGE
jgi:indolepyruvate ferredoxin oxidoreductase beta subunit